MAKFVAHNVGLSGEVPTGAARFAATGFGVTQGVPNVAHQFAVSTALDQIHISAKNYVRDGLVAMWDGKENTVSGAHTTDPTRLGTVVGGATVDWRTSTLEMSDCVTVEGDGILCAALSDYPTYRMRFVVPGILDALDAGLCTLEMCVQPCADGAISSHSTQEWGIAIGVGGNDNSDGFQRWMQDCESLCCSFNDRYHWIPQEDKTTATFNATKLDRQTTTAIASATSAFFSGCVIDNGYRTYSSSQIFWSGAKPTGNDLYIYMHSSTRQHSFRVFNVRFYSRQLTAEEIATNYRIDRVRFNLP